jgi:hypothetical protein
MNQRTALAAALAAAAALLVAGCTASRWQYTRTRPYEHPVTRVTVRSDPPGAEVSLNGDYMGETPFVVPVRYRCEVMVYERRQALPYLHVETKELRTYSSNVFELHFRKYGFRDATRELTLNGEEEIEISVPLAPE